MSRTRDLLAAATLLIAGSCGGDPPVERVGGPLQVWNEGGAVVTGVVAAPGRVMAFGMPTMVVRAPVTIDRVELIGGDRAIRLVDARVSFVACPKCRRRPGYVGVLGRATTACIGRFPPSSFGPAYEAEGLELFPGDSPSLLLYATTHEPGRHVAPGYRIQYRDANGDRYTTESSAIGIAVEQKTGENACNEADGTVWNGGTAGLPTMPLD